MGVARVDLKAYADSESIYIVEDGSGRTNGQARLRFLVQTSSIQPIDDSIRNASGQNENGDHVEILPLHSKGSEPNVPCGSNEDPKWILSHKETTKLGPLLYQVDCTWSKIAELDTLPTYQVNGVRVEETAYYDAENKPILNSAGEIFDPPLIKTYYDTEILVSFSTAAASLADLLSYQGKVNSNAVTFGNIHLTCPAGTLLVAEIMFRDSWLTNVSDWGIQDGYYSIDIRFIYRTDGFVTKVLDQGWNTKNSNDELTTITDEYGERLQQQSKLDGNGGLLEENQEPVFLDFKLTESTDFSSLIGYFQQ